MNKIAFTIVIIAAYSHKSSAMQKDFIELYTRYSIAMGQKHSSSQEEFYQKLLPYQDTPELRQAMESILKEGKTQENTLTDKQIITSILNSKKIDQNKQELDQAIAMLEDLNKEQLADLRNHVSNL